MSQPARSPKPRRPWALLLMLLGLGNGCDDSQHSGNASLDEDRDNTPKPSLDACAKKSTGCPCDEEGARSECGSIKEKLASYVVCSKGVRICSDGAWGECIADHTETEPLSWVAPMQGGFSFKALGTAKSCNNLCDPECLVLEDTPTGLLVPDDLIVDPGGVTLPSGAGGGMCPDLSVAPEMASVTVTGISASGELTTDPTSVAFSATCADSSVVEPKWSLDNNDRAVISASGAVTVFSGIAGTLIVTGATLQDTDTSTVTVNVQVGSLVPLGTTADPGKTLYPYKNTVFPLDLPAPVVQWDTGGITASQVQVALRFPAGSSSPTFLYTETFSSDPKQGPLSATVPAWQVPQPVWSAFDRTCAGDPGGGEILIRRKAGSTSYAELAIPVKFSSESLRGTLYYTQYQRTLGTSACTGQTGCSYPTSNGDVYTPGDICPVGIVTHGSGTLTSQIRAIDLSSPSSVNTDPFGDVGGCPVCHSMSANGETFVAGNQAWQTPIAGGVADVKLTGGAPQLVPRLNAPTYSGLSDFGASDPDGVTLAGASYDLYNNKERAGENSRGLAYAPLTPDGALALQGAAFWGNTADTPAANNTQDASLKGLTGKLKPYHFVDVAKPGLGVQFATTAALSTNTFASGMFSGSSGQLSVDGYTLTALGQSVLVKDEAQQARNGIYALTQISPWKLKRRYDANSSAEILPGMEVRVADGNANNNKVYALSAPANGTVTPDSTALTFTQRTFPLPLFGNTSLSADYASTQPLAPAPVIQNGNVLLAGGLGPLVVDGQTLTLGTSVLVKNETNAAFNGLYTLTTDGTGVAGAPLPVVYATTTALPSNARSGNVLTGNINSVLSIDGEVLALGNGVLVKDEGDAVNNGVYIVTTVGGAGTGVPLEALYATAGQLPVHTQSDNVLTGTGYGPISVDGAVLVAGDSVLVKDETTPAQHGLYTLTGVPTGTGQVLQSVAYATNAALPNHTRSGNVLTGSANGSLQVDNADLVLGNAVLIKNEVPGVNNGVYTVSALGAAGVGAPLTALYASDGALPLNSRDGNVLTPAAFGPLSVDGAALLLGDSVLVKDEAAAANNGVYTLTTLGTGSNTTLASVALATTEALPTNSNDGAGVLTSDAYGSLAVDGTVLVLGDSVLVKNETAAANNGVYTLTAAGSGSDLVMPSVDFVTEFALPANTSNAGVLSPTGFGALMVDGTVLALGDDVLVRNEAAANNNGIYTLTAQGAGTGTPLASVEYATSAALPTNTNTGGVLAPLAWGPLSIDGVTPVLGDAILVQDESVSANNGVYTLSTVGTGSSTLLGAANAATTAALPSYTSSGGSLTPTGFGPLIVDGVTLTAGQSVLVKNEATQSSNGLYTLTTAATGGSASLPSVTFATVAALPANTRAGHVLTATAVGTLAVDGVVVTAGNSILVKNEGASTHNGVYTVTNAGGAAAQWVLTRRSDANSSAELAGNWHVAVSGGATNLGKTFFLATNSPITVNITALTFTQSTKWLLARRSDADTAAELVLGAQVPVAGGTTNGGKTFYLSAPTSGTIALETTSLVFSSSSKWQLTRRSDADANGELQPGTLVPVTAGTTNAGLTFYISTPSAGTISINATGLAFTESSKWELTRRADADSAGELTPGVQVPVAAEAATPGPTYTLSIPESGTINIGTTELGFTLGGKWQLTRRVDADSSDELTPGLHVPVSGGASNAGSTFYIAVPSTGTVAVNTATLTFAPSIKWQLTRRQDNDSAGDIVPEQQVTLASGVTQQGKTFYVSSPESGEITINSTLLVYSQAVPWQLTRRNDADDTGELSVGLQVPVTTGASNEGKTFYIATPSSGTITINSTAIGFSLSKPWALTRRNDNDETGDITPRQQVVLSGGTTNSGKTFFVSSPAAGEIVVNTTDIAYSRAIPWQLTRRNDADDTGELTITTQVGVSSGATNAGVIYYVSSPTSGTITINTTPIQFAAGTRWRLTRHEDVDATGELTPGLEVSVSGGPTNGGKVFYVSSPTSGTITINSSLIAFSEGMLPSMMVPQFSPDGTKIVYVNADADVQGGLAETGWRRGLSLLDFDAETRTVSNKRRLYSTWNASTTGVPIKWPFFEGDSRSILYVESEAGEFCSYADSNHSAAVNSDLRRACFEASYGSMSPTTRGYWKGKLFSLDSDNPESTRVELAKLNDAEDDGGNDDAIDGDRSYQPSVLPQASGGYRWVIFTSPRAWGNQFNQKSPAGTPTHFSCAASMLWMSALTDETAGESDRSHPAFFLPGQKVLGITTANHYVNERGYLVPSQCKDEGSGCNTDDECCGYDAEPMAASCRAQSGWTPASGTPSKTCEALDGECHGAGGSCSTAADCCNLSPCVNFQCAAPGKFESASFTREYVSECPIGYHPDWQLFRFHLTTPGDSKLEFHAQSSQDLVGLDGAPSIELGSSEATAVSPANPEFVDVGGKLEAQGLSRHMANLRVIITFQPSTDRLQAPTLHDWEQRYTCVPAE